MIHIQLTSIRLSPSPKRRKGNGVGVKMPIEILNHIFGYMGATQTAKYLHPIQTKYDRHIRYVGSTHFSYFVLYIWRWREKIHHEIMLRRYH